MKKTTIFIILALFTLFACKKNNTENTEPVNNEPIYFTFDGSTLKNDNSTIVSSDNNLIIGGNANYDYNWSLIKTTKLGKELWRKVLPVYDRWQTGCALVEVENGNLFVCGDTHINYANSGVDIFIVKTNPNGDTLWTKIYGSQDFDYCQNIIETSDGNILISGGTGGTDSIPPGDIYLLKLETNGDTLWTKSYEDQGQQGAHHLLETKNGEYLITGTNQDNDNPNELYLLKVDANGAKLWGKKIGPATGKYGHSTIELSNNNLVICGRHNGGVGGNSQVLIVETDNMGNLIWEQEFGNDSISERGNSIKQNLDGSYTITGTSYEKTAMFGEDIILLKIDQTGNQVWFKKFGSPKTDRGRNLIKDTNDDNLITGDFGWAGPIFLTRTDKDGNFK